MTTDDTLPSGIQDLMHLGGEIAEGLALHGPWLRMTQTPEAAFRATLERLRQAEGRFGEARAAKGDAGKESIAADKALTEWLTRTRGFLTGYFGSRWSERWLEAGVTSRRTAIPKRMEPRLALARGFVAYFARNPDNGHSVAGITEEKGAAFRSRLVRAQRELRQAKAACVVRKRARDAAERALRKKMRQVVVILGVTIRGDDARWLDFGLHRPQAARGGVRPAASLPEGAEPSAPLLLPVAESVAPEATEEAAAA